MINVLSELQSSEFNAFLLFILKALNDCQLVLNPYHENEQHIEVNSRDRYLSKDSINKKTSIAKQQQINDLILAFRFQQLI